MPAPAIQDFISKIKDISFKNGNSKQKRYRLFGKAEIPVNIACDDGNVMYLNSCFWAKSATAGATSSASAAKPAEHI